MTPTDFHAWRRRLGLTQSGAAEALGYTRRMIQQYEAGQRDIPRVVELACRWIEANS